MKERNDESNFRSFADNKSAHQSSDRFNNHRGNFIKDINWMLEHNQKGFMSLIFITFHIFCLLRQVLRSSLYGFCPKTRDMNTGKFENYWLNLAETYYIFDFIHKIDKYGIINRFVAFSALQFLIMRVRAFVMRIKSAKINKYQYNEISIVDMDFGYANEIQLSLKGYFKFLSNLFGHKCQASKELSGPNRGAILEFNRKMKLLSKLDSNRYYNQISFTECYNDSDCLEDYKKKIDSIKIKHEQEHSSRNTISRFNYIFNLNLPNRINYVGIPGHRLDPVHLAWIFALNMITGVGALIAFIIICTTLAFIGLADFDDLGNIQMVRWEKFGDFTFLFALFEHCLASALFVVNIFDCGVLPFSAINSYSRCTKVSKLLWEEVNIYRKYLTDFANFHYNYNNTLELRKRYLLHLDQNDWSNYINESNSDNLSCSSSLFGSNNPSFIHKPLVEIASIVNSGDNGDDSISFHLLLKYYRSRVDEKKILRFNENLDYIMDLIEVLQYELVDHKKVFTTYLNINLIFGTFASSIALCSIIGSKDISTTIMSIAEIIVGAIPLVYTLSIGAFSEGAVSKFMLSFYN